MNTRAVIGLVFPLLAILFAGAGYARPAWFTPLAGLIVPWLMAIMFGMGLTLKPCDFKRAVARWRLVAIGVVLQFALMPAIAWALARLLGLEAPIAIGLLLVGSVAGGTASNVVCLLARADVALSITLTACSTLVSVVATPLLVWLYAGTAVPVPAFAMLASIAQIVALPVAAGMLVNHLIGERWPQRDTACALFSALAIGGVIAVIVALNADAIGRVGLTVVAAIVLHNGIGLAAGYGAARALTGDRRAARTLAIEVGMQNSGLAVALAQQYFSALAALPGALFSIGHNLTGAALAAYWSARPPERLGGEVPGKA